MLIRSGSIRDLRKAIDAGIEEQAAGILENGKILERRKDFILISGYRDAQEFLAAEAEPEMWNNHNISKIHKILNLLDKRRLPMTAIVYSERHDAEAPNRIIDISKTIWAVEELRKKDIKTIGKRYRYNHIDYFKLLPERLEQRMKKADWYYEYSDDHSVWKKGLSEIKDIVNDLKKLSALEGGMIKATALWEKYVPEYSVSKPNFSEGKSLEQQKIIKMTDKEINHIRQQFKNIGAEKAFTPELIEELKRGVSEKQHAYQFKNEGDKAEVVFHLKKSSNSHLYFLNKYDMAITKENKTLEVKQTFYTSDEKNAKLKLGEEKLNNLNRFSLKKSANYLAGRPVFNAFTDKEGNQYEAWAKRKFNVSKGDFEMAKYKKEYPFDMKQAVKNYAIKELAVPEYENRLYESYKRGNLQLVTFVGEGGREEKLYTSLNIGLIKGGSLDVYDLNKDKVSVQELADKRYIGNDFAQQLKDRLSHKPGDQEQTIKIKSSDDSVIPEKKLTTRQKIS